MKKVILSLALLLFVGNMTVQAQDKAAEKAAKEALKAAQKQAKADIAEATKMKEALYAKINDKSVTPEEILAECPKGSALVMKAIKSGGVDEKKISEAWKSKFPDNADFDWQWKKIGECNYLIPK